MDASGQPLHAVKHQSQARLPVVPHGDQPFPSRQVRPVHGRAQRVKTEQRVTVRSSDTHDLELCLRNPTALQVFVTQLDQNAIGLLGLVASMMPRV